MRVRPEFPLERYNGNSVQAAKMIFLKKIGASDQKRYGKHKSGTEESTRKVGKAY